jgi:hypothetical protein
MAAGGGGGRRRSSLGSLVRVLRCTRCLLGVLPGVDPKSLARTWCRPAFLISHLERSGDRRSWSWLDLATASPNKGPRSQQKARYWSCGGLLIRHGGGGVGVAVEGAVLFFSRPAVDARGCRRGAILLLFSVLMLVMFVLLRSSSSTSSGGHGGG